MPNDNGWAMKKDSNLPPARTVHATFKIKKPTTKNDSKRARMKPTRNMQQQPGRFFNEKILRGSFENNLNKLKGLQLG